MSDSSFLGRGWSFPPSFAAGGAEVAMVSGAEDIKQSLQILFGTVPGERIMQGAFGCDLPSLLFAELDQGLVGAIRRIVEQAIVSYESRIDIDRIDVTPSAAAANCVLISLFYTVRGTNARTNLVFPFYLTEATLLPPG